MTQILPSCRKYMIFLMCVYMHRHALIPTPVSGTRVQYSTLTGKLSANTMTPVPVVPAICQRGSVCLYCSQTGECCSSNTTSVGSIKECKSVENQSSSVMSDGLVKYSVLVPVSTEVLINKLCAALLLPHCVNSHISVQLKCKLSC